MFLLHPAIPRATRRRRRRIAAAVVLGATLTWVGATSADAHVHLIPDTTAAGSIAALTLRVPNESDTAGTVKVSVQLPQDTPFLEVSSRPVPGWTVASAEEPLPKPVTYEGTTITKAVRTVTWTAESGTRIALGEYQEFSVSAGPLPDAGVNLQLPVTQTYSDGQVVHWDQATPASGAEPEHPAPAFVVTAAQPETGAAASSPAPTPVAAPVTPAGGTTGGTTDSVARVLGVGGLVLGAAGLVVGLWSRRRQPKPPTP